MGCRHEQPLHGPNAAGGAGTPAPRAVGALPSARPLHNTRARAASFDTCSATVSPGHHAAAADADVGARAGQWRRRRGVRLRPRRRLYLSALGLVLLRPRLRLDLVVRHVVTLRSGEARSWPSRRTDLRFVARSLWNVHTKKGPGRAAAPTLGMAPPTLRGGAGQQGCRCGRVLLCSSARAPSRAPQICPPPRHQGAAHARAGTWQSRSPLGEVAVRLLEAVRRKEGWCGS
eukprot:362630-Chlamydomonas_euryale.AAC.4